METTLKVLVVDDSAVFRGAVAEALKADGSIQVVGSVWNGVKALEFIRSHRPDLITLDIEMPEMDGLQTLEAIQRLNGEAPALPAIGVIMVSAHTHAGAISTIRALELGAFDFVTKPESRDAAESIAILREQLLAKVHAFAVETRKSAAPIAPPQVAPQPPRPAQAARQANAGSKAVLIGVSTGGPKALAELLPDLTTRIEAPVFIVQHMPPVFTHSLAESLARKCRYDVIEAKHNETVRERTAYIAPGGKHLVVRKGVQGEILTGINDQPPENNCKPAVDVLFRSAAAVYGGDAVAVVLTGMGTDGTKGLGPLRRAGAHVIVQDQATSVVWGMPGSAVASGLADKVLPLGEIPEAIAAQLNKA